ncbi:MAG: rRNA maturation RNase YbeY [Parcubacteria group bacterium]|jgi:probable rRNA maturation factor
MKLSVEINNLTRKKISQTRLTEITKDVIKYAKFKAGSLSLSVVFVGKSRIKNLNQTYRKKNKETDILSFNYSLGYNAKKRDGQAALEGELIICPDVIAQSAKKHKVDFEKELAFVFSHGILHLFGFRHSKRMYSIQDKISEKN